MSSDYRLAPALGARLLGSLLLALALVVFATTVMVALLGWSPVVVIVVAALGVVSVLVAGHVLTRRTYVVRLDEVGYQVRLVRGAGVKAARWRDVQDAVTASPRGIPVLVLQLRDGRSTTIPVQALAADREEFVRDVRAHLEADRGGS